MCETGRNRLNFFFFSSFIVVTVCMVCMGGMRARDIIYYRCINCLLCQYRARLRHNALSFSKVNRLTVAMCGKQIYTDSYTLDQTTVCNSICSHWFWCRINFLQIPYIPRSVENKDSWHDLSIWIRDAWVICSHWWANVPVSVCLCANKPLEFIQSLSLSLKSSLLNVWIMKFQYYRPICNVLVRSSASSTEKGTHRRRKRIG